MSPPGDDLLWQLLAVSRDFEPRLLRELQPRGHTALPPSFARFLYLVWDEPRTLQAIAAELGLSRQAVSQMARRIETAGYVERRPNPADGRSKLVVITAQGRAVDDDRARASIAACEAHYEALVGAPTMHRFIRALGLLRQHLDLPAQPSSRRDSLGVLPLVALRARDERLRQLGAKGHAGVTPAQHDLLVLVGTAGARAVELARALGVSRQAVSSTLAELEQVGYLRRSSGGSGARAVAFVPSRQGHELLDHDADAIDAVEAAFTAALGRARMAQLRVDARDLLGAVRGESTAEIGAMAAQLRRELGPAASARLGAMLLGVAS